MDGKDSFGAHAPPEYGSNSREREVREGGKKERKKKKDKHAIPVSHTDISSLPRSRRRNDGKKAKDENA